MHQPDDDSANKKGDNQPMSTDPTPEAISVESSGPASGSGSCPVGLVSETIDQRWALRLLNEVKLKLEESQREVKEQKKIIAAQADFIAAMARLNQNE